MATEADWPYEKVEKREITTDPSWLCPNEKCSCQEQETEAKAYELSIMLCTPEGERMGGARCRVVANGMLVNLDEPNADGEGWITVEVEHDVQTVWVEWAPADTPLRPDLPYRKRYFVDLAEHDEEESTRRRLHNLGFSFLPSLRENIQDFQYTYDYEELTGEIEDIRDDLLAFHDGAMVPKVTEPMRDRGEQPGQAKDSQFQLASFGPRAGPDGGGGQSGPAKKQPPPGPPASKGNPKAGGGNGAGTAKLALSPEVKRLSLTDTMNAGEEVYFFYSYEVETKTRKGIFWMFQDALVNKNRSWLRLPCSAAEAELAARKIKKKPSELGGWPKGVPSDGEARRSFFLTPKLMDIRWIQTRDKKANIDPCPQDINAPIWGTSVKMNRCVEKQANPIDTVADPGKIWAVSNRLGTKVNNLDRAINYGWHVNIKPHETQWRGTPAYVGVTPGLRLLQSEGGTHDCYHIDYSQILLLVAGWCVVEDPKGSTPKRMKTEEVYADKDLSELVNHDGALKHVTQPFDQAAHEKAMGDFWQREEAKFRHDRLVEEEKKKREEEKKKREEEKKKREEEKKKPQKA
ncbi:MAG: hypothetical protein R3B70_31130 [Polyangiaceae bacterium]